MKECLRLGLALTTALGHWHAHGLADRAADRIDAAGARAAAVYQATRR